MDMNSPTGKAILALVRKADYAHAGEEAAINIAFKDISKDPGRLLLDVGCGRGGAAKYIQDGGWGKVLGIDIDADSIQYAKMRYPDIEFMAADAMTLSGIFTRRFDLIYLFNAFYAFADHRKVLEELRRLSREEGRLVIFDYLIKCDRKIFPFKEWNPIDLSVSRKLFADSGWRIVKTDDISPLYRKWYRELVLRIETASRSIISFAGEEWFDFVRSFYRGILDAVEKDMLGGAIVYAQSE